MFCLQNLFKPTKRGHFGWGDKFKPGVYRETEERPVIVYWTRWMHFLWLVLVLVCVVAELN
jgi:hypothetical protein